MPQINILSPHMADLIAAGEVVERPASVIKELMENSLDAGAKNIVVEIKAGGAPYIRINDDGCGMAPEDAGIAFLRHATSKLHDEGGLAAIGTMGFRGEALAAISAVSRIEMMTKRREDREGTIITLTAGDIQDMHTGGCPDGTSIIVRDIFYNTPARMKFLKSDRAEASACQQAALRVALGHPEVSVRFIKDGTDVFFTPGDTKAESCIYTLLGRDAAKDMLPLSAKGEAMSVRGFVSTPANCKGNRAGQYFFCNGRFIKSPLIQQAVEQAFKNSLLPGRYPVCVLYLTLAYANVDVNVHPAKTEVKFVNEKPVFDLVYHAVLGALEKESLIKVDNSGDSANISGKIAPKSDFYQTMSAEEYRNGGYGTQGKSTYTASRDFAQNKGKNSPALHSASVSYQTKMDMSPPKNSLPIERGPIYSAEINSEKISAEEAKNPDKAYNEPAKFVEKSVGNVENPNVPPHKILGEAMKTYIIVEIDNTLMLIDKHAAHERMIFNSLKAQEQEIPSQALMIPEPVSLSGADLDTVEKNARLFSQLGFDMEPYGEGAYIIRGVPADMDGADAASAVEEICEKLRACVNIDPKARRDKLLQTVACKAAVKAGWDTQPQELEYLVNQVISGNIKYCPHGRPVTVTLSRNDLDKMFKRIV